MCKLIGEKEKYISFVVATATIVQRKFCYVFKIFDNILYSEALVRNLENYYRISFSQKNFLGGFERYYFYIMSTTYWSIFSFGIFLQLLLH